ncbi:MAG: Hsp33 family molecular chaperone HslO [Clostridia bacterium]|nr:Hsp33 family molecular chaperone HslO [Clostridia bacterium]
MDKIIRTLICEGQVSLAVIDATDLVNNAIKIHGINPDASSIFGGLLACGAYLSSSLKDERGSVSLTIKAMHGDGAASVSADSSLHVRGYVDGTCSDTLVGGTLTVVRDDGRTIPFVGTCEIDTDDVSEILEIYFQQSEQIPTAVALTCDISEDGTCLSCGGVIMQLLPDADDDQTQIAGEAFDLFKEKAGAIRQGADYVYEKFFARLASGEAAELYPQYKCNCSLQKIRGVLASVGKEELLKIIEETGEVRVHCHYCNRDYVFDRGQIEGFDE